MTTRGFTAADFNKVAEFFDRGVQIALAINKSLPGKKLVDFKAAVATSPPKELAALQAEVRGWGGWSECIKVCSKECWLP